MWTLAERTLRARYKAAVLGLGWALLTPVALMLVFTLFFNRIAEVETRGVPYPLFAYMGLVPWTFFSAAVSQGAQSMVVNGALLSRIRCPREVFPVSAVVVAACDAAVSVPVLLVLFAVLDFAPAVTSAWVPVLLVMQIATTFGVVFAVSAVLVYFRDLQQAIPLVLQMAIFATPVAYGLDSVPRRLQQLYALVNPLAPVIHSYRRTVLYGAPPDWDLLALGGVTTVVILVGGYALFKRLEMGMADLV